MQGLPLVGLLARIFPPETAPASLAWAEERVAGLELRGLQKPNMACCSKSGRVSTHDDDYYQ